MPIVSIKWPVSQLPKYWRNHGKEPYIYILRRLILIGKLNVKSNKYCTWSLYQHGLPWCSYRPLAPVQPLLSTPTGDTSQGSHASGSLQQETNIDGKANHVHGKATVGTEVRVCAICMKYRIIILIIISLGQILLSYIANIWRTHPRTPTPPPFRLSCSMGPNHDGVNAPFSPVLLANNGRSLLHSNKQSRGRLGIRNSFGCFSRIKNLGRTETRIRDRMYFQSIRTVWYISWDDRARIATCSLLTATDRQTDLGRIIV